LPENAKMNQFFKRIPFMKSFFKSVNYRNICIRSVAYTSSYETSGPSLLLLFRYYAHGNVSVLYERENSAHGEMGLVVLFILSP
jgi:hypothetical protein